MNRKIIKKGFVAFILCYDTNPETGSVMPEPQKSVTKQT